MQCINTDRKIILFFENWVNVRVLSILFAFIWLWHNNGNICCFLTHTATWYIQFLDTRPRPHAHSWVTLLTRVGHVCVLILAKHFSVLKAGGAIVQAQLTYNVHPLPANYFTYFIIWQSNINESAAWFKFDLIFRDIKCYSMTSGLLDLSYLFHRKLEISWVDLGCRWWQLCLKLAEYKNSFLLKRFMIFNIFGSSVFFDMFYYDKFFTSWHLHPLGIRNGSRSSSL